jgi:hypothetical protein
MQSVKGTYCYGSMECAPIEAGLQHAKKPRMMAELNDLKQGGVAGVQFIDKVLKGACMHACRIGFRIAFVCIPSLQHHEWNDRIP